MCQDKGRHRDAIAWARKALAEAERSDDREAMAHAYKIIGWADLDLGRLEDDADLRRALALYEELGDLVGQGGVLNMLGGAAYFRGRWADALRLYERARDIMRRTGNPVIQAFYVNNIAEILSDQGHLDEAEALLREASTIWRSAGYVSGVAYAASNLGRVAARAGRYDEALTLFEEARAGSHAAGAQVEELENRRTRRRVHPAGRRSLRRASPARTRRSPGRTRSAASPPRARGSTASGGSPSRAWVEPGRRAPRSRPG